MDEQADTAIDARSEHEDDQDGSVYRSIRACRDRALVYLDNSEQMVRKRYSHIEAGEQADMATEALAVSDQRVRANIDDDGRAADRDE